MDIKAGDIVVFRAEWRDAGEPAIPHVVIEWNGDRGIVSPLTWPTPLVPQELVRAQMVQAA